MIPEASASGINAFARLLTAVLSLAILACPARADTYQWNGGTSGVWSVPSNWNPSGTPAGITIGPAATGGNFNHRLNVNNGGANALTYDSSLGVTRYGGAGVRGLVVGSGSTGSMRITGGTFDTTNSDTWDVVGSGVAGSLTMDDGVFISDLLLLGLNNGSGSGTVTVNGGAATIGNIQFNYQSAGGTGTVNLNGGTLTTSLINEAATGANGNHIMNFNGGTLTAGASGPLFLPNILTRANVRNGGAKVDTNGFEITIGQALIHSVVSGDAVIDGGLTKNGPGKLTLTNANTYTGPTVINSGTLALGAAASLAETANVSIASGASFDLSAYAAYVWPPGRPLIAAGGALKGGAAIDLGASPVTLNFTPTGFSGDLTHPALVVPSGTLTINGAISIHNNAASPLGTGTYRLLSQVQGALSGTPTFSGTVTGQGIQAGEFCFLQIAGGNLDLVVQSPTTTTTTLTRTSGTVATSTYGDTLHFAVAVSPPSATGIVELFDGGTGGTLIGTAELSDGAAAVTPVDTALATGSHANLVARYVGTPSHLASSSSALSPAQSVTVKSLTLADVAALDKYYDSTTVATIFGTLVGVETGDSVTLNPTGAFASPNPGTNIEVTPFVTLSGSSAVNYIVAQPTDLAADIIAANVWTGGAGNAGTNLATGTNYSPAASPANVYNAIFNGLDPATTDLTLSSAIGGAVGTSGMVFGFAGNQTNPVTIIGSTGASARIASIIVAPGAAGVTFQGVLPFILGGPTSDTSHSFINGSVSPLVFQNTGNWIPGGSGSQLRAMVFGGVGDITVASSIVPSVPSRMSLTKSGSGTLNLAGANTFSGGTTISGGKVVATTSAALGTGAVVNHGMLDLNAGAVTYTGLSSFLSGAGVVNVTLGTGTATTLLNGNYSNFTGTWNLGIVAATGAGKVQMNGPDHPSATIHVLENATLYTTSGTHAASLVLHGGNTGESLGQLRIEGSASWAGDITLAGPITGSGDGHIGAASGTGTISGTIGESGGSQGLVKDGDGAVILSGYNTYTGPTEVNDGTLLVNSPGSLAAASAVTVNSGARVAGSGVIHGPVTVASGGTLGGSLALNSPVTVQAGGTLDATGTTQPSLNATSTLTLSGFLDLSIDRTRTPKASNLNISGTLNRGGTLRVINSGPALRLGDSFTISISGAQWTGSFSSTLWPALDYGLAWNTSQFASNGTITVVANTGFTPSTVTLTPATTHQQIHGIGANFALGPQSIAWNTSNFNLAFSPSGLNISFARLSNSFECGLDEPEIFWSGWDSDNVRFIQMFRAIQPDGLITMSSWSPPGRFKSTGSANGGTLAKSGNAYRYADFANWWLRSLQYLRDNSTLPVEQAIPDFISIQNEPDFTPGGDPFYAPWQAGCYLDSVESSTKAGYPQALAAVKSAFQSGGFGSVEFIGPDTTTASPSVISSYVNNVPAGSFAAIAHHPYQGSTNNVGNNTGDLSGLRAAYPNSDIYMTEFFGDDSYGATVPGWMQHCLPMHNIFAIEKANTYLMWGLSLSTTSDTFCALGQYSKFIRPGDWRSAATGTDPNLKITLFRHAVGAGVPDQLILVMINNSAAYSYPTVQTSAHWASDPVRRLWMAYKTADDGSSKQRITLTENLSGASLTGDRNLVLAPYSITTILINSDAAPTNHENWRFQYFGATANLGNAADSFDSNGDGETNLYEFATGQNPVAGTLVSPSIIENGASLEFSYTRSKAAVLDGLTFTIEWSDTLAPGSWSSTGVTESTTQQTDTLEIRLARMPRGTTGSRFVRLRIGP